MDSASSNIKSQDVRQKLVHKNEGKLRSKKIDPKISRELLAAAVIKHDLPVSFVEYDGVRDLLKYVNPDAPCISKNTLMLEIKKIHAEEKQKIKHVLKNMRSGICLTCDIWTGGDTSEKYICLSGQFVDENWKLSSKILDFDVLPYPQSGLEVAKKIIRFMYEWGVQKKVISLTLDDTSSANHTQDSLKTLLSSYGFLLLCEGEFSHIRCLAHTLDTIGEEGMDSIDFMLRKIRESLEFVKSSEDKIKMFETCMRSFREIDNKIGLSLDVSTRWDSTYLMLYTAIKYRKAFSSLQPFDVEYGELCPSSEEWERAEIICEILELLYDTAKLISGSFHPTSNLYFMQVWKIGVVLVENLSSEDAVISDVCRRMKEKFDEYWSENSTVLACGAILDPRIKLSMLDFFYSKIESDPIKCQEMMSLAKTKLCKLFEHYTNIATKLSSSQPQFSLIKHSPWQLQNGGAIKDKRKRFFDEITAYESQTVRKAEKSQLDHYLEDAKLQFSNYEDLDVLEYWKNHEHRYPILASMARDVLAIPFITGASESTFSIGANVLGKHRGCTLPKIVRTLVCTRNWLHGYAIDNEESAGNRAISSAGR